MAEFDEFPDEAQAARQLEELFAAHRKDVLYYVRRRAPADSVDEIVAETFVIAWRRLDRVPADSPLPWLLAVARNLTDRLQRGAARRQALTIRLQERTVTEAAGPPVVQEPAGPVVEAMKRLGERDREAIELVALDGLKPGEAAQVLGMLPGAFRVRLHRAKHRLRRLIEQQSEHPAEPSPRRLTTKETRT